jgi:hypothetical protein
MLYDSGIPGKTQNHNFTFSTEQKQDMIFKKQ